MAFKCVNELDKFMFQDAEVKKMELNPALMTMVLMMMEVSMMDIQMMAISMVTRMMVF